VQIARSTMCAWLAAMGELARPLVARMGARILQSRAVHTGFNRRSAFASTSRMPLSPHPYKTDS
jgi:hypothetical protein